MNFGRTASLRYLDDNAEIPSSPVTAADGVLYYVMPYVGKASRSRRGSVVKASCRWLMPAYLGRRDEAIATARERMLRAG